MGRTVRSQHERKRQGHAPDVHPEHLWVAGVEVLIDPAQLARFVRERRSEYPRDRTTHRKHYPSIEGSAVVLEVYCRRCRQTFDRAEDGCAPWAFAFDRPSEDVKASHGARERIRDQRLARKIKRAMFPALPEEFPPWDELACPLDEGETYVTLTG